MRLNFYDFFFKIRQGGHEIGRRGVQGVAGPDLAGEADGMSAGGSGLYRSGQAISDGTGFVPRDARQSDAGGSGQQSGFHPAHGDQG